MKKKRDEIESLIEFCDSYPIKAKYINDILEKLETTPLKQSVRLTDLLLRPQLGFENLRPYIKALEDRIQKITERTEEILEATEIRVKYQGYIDREKGIAEKIHRLENIKIAGKLNYKNIQSISIEARQKLTRINPETIGQASRIPGISPNDINTLLILLGR